ncbi:MAG: hypothetical protein ABIQ10_01355 [Gemmatimonadaceae bacterium]
MRSRTRIAFAGTIAGLLLTAACSDSSGPSIQSQSAAIAAHFDSIYVDAKARYDSGATAYEGRVLIASILEIPAALGALPSPIQVTTALEPEQWKGYELMELNPTGTDSVFVLIAYRDSDAHSVIVVFFDASGAPNQGALITDDTTSVAPTSGSAATSFVSASSACLNPPGSLSNPQFDAPLFTSCTLAKFHTALTLEFPSGSIDAGLTSLTFSPTPATINGLRVVDTPSSNSRRLRVLLAAHGFRKRM